MSSTNLKPVNPDLVHNVESGSVSEQNVDKSDSTLSKRRISNHDEPDQEEIQKSNVSRFEVKHLGEEEPESYSDVEDNLYAPLKEFQETPIQSRITPPFMQTERYHAHDSGRFSRGGGSRQIFPDHRRRTHHYNYQSEDREIRDYGHYREDNRRPSYQKRY